MRLGMPPHQIIGTLLLSTGLAACTISQPEGHTSPKEMSQVIQQGIKDNQALNQRENAPPPAAVSNALIPEVNVQLPEHQAQTQRFNVAVNDAPARVFYQSLVKDTPYNIVVSPDLHGVVSLNLKHVTVPEVLDAMQDLYGYDYEKTSYGYAVYPPKLETKMFNVSYLNIDRGGKSETSISSGQISSKISTSSAGSNSSSETTNETNTVPASTVTTETKNNFWNELATTLDTIVGVKQTTDTSTLPTSNSQTKTITDVTGGKADDGLSVTVNPQAGIVLIKAYPAQLREVKKYLDSVQSIMDREVIIDARILEVRLNAGYQAGIDWNILGIKQTGNQDFNDNLKTFSGIFDITASRLGAFSMFINLLDQQGVVNVLSSPRISTVNNQKAVIKVGTDDFFVTGIESNVESSSSSSGSSVVGNNVDLTPFFSGVALDVTPEIDENGEIILHIHPIVSEVTEKKTSFTAGGTTRDEVPLASSTIRESDSIVRAQSGQMIVIGGLMENDTNNHQASTPFLSHIPGIGGLFKTKNNVATKTELVILLQPTVVQQGTWNTKLKTAAEAFDSLNEDFRFKTTVGHKKQKPNIAKGGIKVSQSRKG